MKVWFDADNAPHVLVMKPVADALALQGHSVFFTARDRSSTVELLRMYGYECRSIGGRYPRGIAGKVLGTLHRALRLSAVARREHPAVSFGHGSRALPIASRLAGVPSVTMYDYEWVNPSVFNRFCRSILLPDAIEGERCAEAGIDRDKVVRFPGFKENIYLRALERDPSVAAGLGLDPALKTVLVRPPATTAHYHNPEAEVILSALLDRLLSTEGIQIVWIPRDPDPCTLEERSGAARVIVPDRVYPGPGMILECDLVVGGGGTMTREAAVLGIPAVTFFRGRKGRVDETLERMGRLRTMESPGEAAAVVEGMLGAGRLEPLVSDDAVPVIVGAIEGAGGPG